MNIRAKEAGLTEDYLPQNRLTIYTAAADLAKSIFTRIGKGLEPNIANPQACLDMLKPIIISNNNQILYLSSID
jgi:hypothetical protein